MSTPATPTASAPAAEAKEIQKASDQKLDPMLQSPAPRRGLASSRRRSRSRSPKPSTRLRKSSWPDSDSDEKSGDDDEDDEDYEDGGYKITWAPYGEEESRWGYLPKEHFQVKKFPCGCHHPLIPWSTKRDSLMTYECVGHAKMGWAMKKEQEKKDNAKKEQEADWKAYGEYTDDEEGRRTYACGCVWLEKESEKVCVLHAKSQ